MFKKFVFQSAAVDGGEASGGGAAGVIGDGAGPNDAGEASGGGASDLPEWAKDDPPELAGVVREAKWENPQQAVESYNALLSLKGAPADRLLKLPGSPDSDESKAFLAQHMGVPGEASEYELDAVQVPEGTPDLRDSIRDALHAARVPADAAPGLVQSINEALAKDAAAAEEAKDGQFAEAKAQLDSKWGGESELRWSNVQKAYDLLGVPGDVADKIALGGEGGPEQFFLRLEEMGRRMGEPTDHGKSGSATGGFISQQQAEARLDEIAMDHTKDPNDPAVRKEMDRLALIARPGRISL